MNLNLNSEKGHHFCIYLALDIFVTLEVRQRCISALPRYALGEAVPHIGRRSHKDEKRTA